MNGKCSGCHRTGVHIHTTRPNLCSRCYITLYPLADGFWADDIPDDELTDELRPWPGGKLPPPPPTFWQSVSSRIGGISRPIMQIKINWTAASIAALVVTQIPGAINGVHPWWKSYQEHLQREEQQKTEKRILERIRTECSESARTARGPIEVFNELEPDRIPIIQGYEFEDECKERIRNGIGPPKQAQQQITP